MSLTSRLPRHLANNMAGGVSSLIVGDDDLHLLAGKAVGLRELLERMGSAFDVMVTVDAVRGLTIVHGEDRCQIDGLARRDPMEIVSELLRNEELSVLVVVYQAGLVYQDPDTHDITDRLQVAQTDLALTEAQKNGEFRNTLVLVAPTVDDIPAVLRANPRLAIVEQQLPERAERRMYLAVQVPQMHGGADLDEAEVDHLVATLCRLTDDMSLRDLESICFYSNAMRVPVTEPRELIHRHRFSETPNYWEAVRRDFRCITKELFDQVHGQDDALVPVVASLAGAVLGLDMTGDPYSPESQPRAVLLLLGPTGVGKTHLAKVLAGLLFGDRSAYNRVDMATMAQAHQADQLTGAPPGYEGHRAGGQVTEAAMRRPFSVHLFDEIEKAHPIVWERLMSLFDDGRLTDGRGRVAYFGESVVILTSNLGSTELRQRAGTGGLTTPTAVDLAAMSPDEVKETLVGATRAHFDDIGRPEVWGRLAQGAVPFQPLRADGVAAITEQVIRDTSFVRGPAIEVDLASAIAYMQEVMLDPEVRNLGGRQIRNVLRTSFQRVAMWVTLNGHADASTVAVSFARSGELTLTVDAVVAVVPTDFTDQIRNLIKEEDA